MKKRLLGIGIVLLGLFLTIVPVSALASGDVVEPTKEFYVADYAKVLNSSTEKWIVKQNEDLYKRTGAQIVVVTVDFLGGMEIEDYAYKLFNKWGIGSKEKNNGVLLLLAIGEDNYWCVQGRGLESALDSGAIGDILYDNLESDFAKGKYDTGAKRTFDVLFTKVDAISAKITPMASASAQTTYKPVDAGYVRGTTDASSQSMLPLFFIGLLLFAFYLMYKARQNNISDEKYMVRRKQYTVPDENGQQTIHVSVEHHSYKSRSDDDDHSTRHSWSSSGGSSHSSSSSFHSGGSSSSSSGSGRSGGGGSGGSNSGGGGSTRGGGAGRR